MILKINLNRNKSVIMLFLTLSFLCFFNCSKVKETKEVKEDEDVSAEKESFLSKKNEVATFILERIIFHKELISNGKLIAQQKGKLNFEISGELQHLNVKNGSWVKKGTRLASLKQIKFQQRLESAEISLKKTMLELEDKLVGRGYTSILKDSIPKKIYDMVSIRSGYAESQQRYKEAKRELELTILKAPFSGKVANLKHKIFEQVSSGRPFLTLINDAIFEVEFPIIESEFKDLKLGNQIKVFPFAVPKEYKGEISSINPIVDKNGTISVKAVVKNDGELLEGMNVKVKIQKELGYEFVVPKSAVVLRQNQEVLFKVINGKAHWTYVHITNENSTSYTVIPNPNKAEAFLIVGDSIIISGNLNLAHDSSVSVKN